MPLGPVNGRGGIAQHRVRRAGEADAVLLAILLVGCLRFPVQGAVQPVHQRVNDAEVARLHQLTAMVQRMQTAHLANPRQARHGVLVRQVFAGVHQLVAHIPQQHAAGEQRGEVAVDMRQQPPDPQQRQAVEHDQPGREKDHPPVARRLVTHQAFDEEAVVITGVALVEQLAEARLVVAQALVHLVLAPAEEHQAQRHQQPLPGRHRIQAPP